MLSRGGNIRGLTYNFCRQQYNPTIYLCQCPTVDKWENNSPGVSPNRKSTSSICLRSFQVWWRPVRSHFHNCLPCRFKSAWTWKLLFVTCVFILQNLPSLSFHPGLCPSSSSHLKCMSSTFCSHFPESWNLYLWMLSAAVLYKPLGTFNSECYINSLYTEQYIPANAINQIH